MSRSETVNGLDLFESRIAPADILKAEELLKVNFGVEYPREKFAVLWKMILEDKWSKERFEKTVKWFLKNKKFANWTFADFYDYKIELHSIDWALQENHKTPGAMSRMVKYKINGTVFFAYPSPELIDLPFEPMED